jgi:hypothetical protein
MIFCFSSPKYPIPKNSENFTMGVEIAPSCKYYFQFF